MSDGKQLLYDVVVYGNEIASSLMLQYIHEKHKDVLQPTWDPVFIIAGVVLSVSTAGIRVRMAPRISQKSLDLSCEEIEDRAISRYEGLLVRSFLIPGIVVCFWAALRSVLWRDQVKKYKAQYPGEG